MDDLHQLPNTFLTKILDLSGVGAAGRFQYIWRRDYEIWPGHSLSSERCLAADVKISPSRILKGQIFRYT